VKTGRYFRARQGKQNRKKKKSSKDSQGEKWYPRSSIPERKLLELKKNDIQVGKKGGIKGGGTKNSCCLKRDAGDTHVVKGSGGVGHFL